MTRRILGRGIIPIALCLAFAGCKSKSSSNPSQPNGDAPRAKKESEDKAGLFEWVGGQSPYQLICRESVRNELGITAEQFAKVQQLQHEESAKMGAARKERNEKEGKPSNLGDLKGVTTMMKTLDEAVQKMMTEAQTKRLEQIAMQYRVHHHGVLWLFNRASIQQRLGMTDSQQELVTSLVRDEKKAIDETRRSRDPAAVKPFLDRFYGGANDKLLASLSPEQHKKWQEVLGRPFDLAAAGFAVRN